MYLSYIPSVFLSYAKILFCKCKFYFYKIHNNKVNNMLKRRPK